MSPSLLFEFFIALGIGGMLKTLLDYYIAYNKTKIKGDFQKQIDLINQTYSILNDILVQHNASRVVLLKTTNGGGVPKLGCLLYSSIIYEVYQNHQKAIKQKWQSIKVDESYVEMLFEVLKKGYSLVSTGGIKKGLLRTLYEKEGIDQSLVYYIKENKTDFIYLSINFDNKSEINKDDIDLSISQIRALFK